MTRAMTVLGEIPSKDLGFTLPHEHIFVDLFTWPGGKSSTGRLGIIDPVLDRDIMTKEVDAFREVGGQSLVELSLNEIGRNPEELKRMAESTGINIIMGCGWYRDSYMPEDLNYRPTDDLAEELIYEYEYGVGDTDIRPGIIGEIGLEGEYPTAREERVFRAAARAHLRTGLAITTHTTVRTSGLQVLKILEQEGVPPDRIIIGHADCYPVLEYLLELLQQGCYIEFDYISFLYHSGGISMPYSAEAMAKLTLKLIQQGYANRILLSHDIGMRPLLNHYGGVGYTCLSDQFIPLLKRSGVSEEDIHTMTVENPSRVLAV